MADPFDLQRFLEAQEHTYAQACSELQTGRKRGHWMWFIFPQFAGLGRSATSQRYAIRSLDEARAYLAHAVLGARLRACAGLMVAATDRTASQILGFPDDLKLRSSMTLFAQLDEDDAVFEAVIREHFAGRRDQRTLELIGQLVAH